MKHIKLFETYTNSEYINEAIDFKNVSIEVNGETLTITLNDNGQTILDKATKFEISSDTAGRKLLSDTKSSGLVFTPRLDDIKNTLPKKGGFVDVNNSSYYKHTDELTSVMFDLKRYGKVELIKVD